MSKNIAGKITILTCFLMLTISASAARLSFKYYTTADGLVSDNVNRIVPDSRGFLWFCNDDGLSRFDGYEFKNYTQDQGLPSRNINDFLETKDGTYLLATSGGLAVFDPNGKAYRWNILTGNLEQTSAEPPIFRTFFPPVDAKTNTSKSILTLAQTSDGSIYVGTHYGLFRFEKNGPDWAFTKVEFPEWSGKDINFNALFVDSNKGLWIITSAALYRMSRSGTIKKINDLGGNTIFEDAQHRVWIDGGGNRIGIRVYVIDDADEPVLTKTYTSKDGLPDEAFTNAIAQTYDGKIFISANGKLCEFLETANANEPKFRRLQDDIVNTGSGAIDKSGNLWFGVAGKGAWKHSPNSFSVYDERDGLSNERIATIFGNSDDDVFFIAGNQKITQVGADIFGSVLPYGRIAQTRGENFTAFQSGDDWWIAAKDVLRHYVKIDQFHDLAKTPPARIFGKSDGVSGTGVTSVFEDSRGDIWFSLENSEVSAFRWDKSTDKIVRYETVSGLTTLDSAVSYGEDASGNVWIGFFFGALARYKAGEFRVFTANDGFPQGMVSDMFSDKQGRFWLATASRGLIRIDDSNSDTPTFTNVSTANGLSSNQTFCLTEDSFGKIYVGTGHGINRLDPETQKIKIYTQADGLPTNYVSQCYADKKGLLWFAANSALISYSPTNDKADPPPPIFIDGIRVNGITKHISELGESEIKGLELNPDERQIQLKFFGLSFGTGDVLRYQYKLEGQDWSVPDTQRTVAFNLAAGNYQIAVRAVSASGVVSDGAATVSFTIARPVWQRWWFLALILLTFGVVAFAFVRSRETKRKQIATAREERLAELQRVRTRIANDLHDDIGSSLTQIAVLSEVARGQAHVLSDDSLRMPLERIRNVSKELVASMSDVVWAINPNKDFLRDLVQRMRRFASDVFTGKEISFEFNSPEDESNPSLGANIRREVLAIFKEAINNTVKYSECSRAVIDFRIENDHLILQISDDGLGFDTETVLSDDFSPEQGGNGLVNIRRRAKELGGTCEITSGTGKGTAITLEIPV